MPRRVSQQFNQRGETAIVINSNECICGLQSMQTKDFFVSKCFNMAAWIAVHATFFGHVYCSGQCLQMHSEY